jgi:hypothetical protein
LSSKVGKWNASARFYMMRENCGGRPPEDNSVLILTAGRWGWWTETELQNRFQPKCGMEFGILVSDDEMAGFSGWERKLGLWTGAEQSVY